MMQVRQNQGKLCEVIFADPLAVDELTAFTLEVRRLVSLASEPLVFCCDWRKVASFEKTTVDTIVWTMRRDNPKIGFNAILVDPKNTQCRNQVEHILREADNPRRRCFTDIASLTAALDRFLSPAERGRLDQFLAGAPLSSRA
jgi:hypothetical protein